MCVGARVPHPLHLACGYVHGYCDSDGDSDGGSDGQMDGETDGEVDGERGGANDGEVDDEMDGNNDGDRDGDSDGDGDGGIDGPHPLHPVCGCTYGYFLRHIPLVGMCTGTCDPTGCPCFDIKGKGCADGCRRATHH